MPRKKRPVPPEKIVKSNTRLFQDDWHQQFIENYWLGLGDTSGIEVNNPFDNMDEKDIERPDIFLLNLMRKPENFWLTCKILFDLELHPFQQAILRELWKRPFPMVMGSRGMGKTFILALYAMLRALFYQGSKIVIVGAAFRQAKVVFDYCQGLWEKGPVYRSLLGNDSRNGPRRDIDKVLLRVGESIISGMPLGDGSKIRGQRANIILCDEFASVPVEIFETVVRGFAAVSLSPIEKLKEEARKEALRELGADEELIEDVDDGTLVTNQTILSSTPYYSFNHLYEYWRRYRKIIESMGDKATLEEMFGGVIPDQFSWQDYIIIRIPYKKLPPGFMDEKQISQARATMSHGTYLMEYGACQAPGTKIVTDTGVKEIQDMKPGDMVLTHKGRFRPVEKVTVRRSGVGVVSYKTWGCDYTNEVTHNHPFFTPGGDWVQLADLEQSTYLSNLKRLSGQTKLDLREYIDDYMTTYCGTKIYPRHSQSKLTREEVEEIRESEETQTRLAKRYGVRQSTIQRIKTLATSPKNSIPAVIDLDYDFGLIVGYYAAEGSVGAKGRAVGFALDGHINTRLRVYVEQLKDAVERVFGFDAKVYIKDEETANVTLNQRLLGDLFSSICPGVAHTKMVAPEVLYSNSDFLKGFLVGFWNGDGHISWDNGSIVAACTSLNLMSQVRVALSRFCISSSLNIIPPRAVKIKDKLSDCREAYAVKVGVTSKLAFMRFLYDEWRWGHGPKYQTRRARQKIQNTHSYSRFDIREKEVRPYSGFVYNLHVKEDQSYSLLNATVHNCFSEDSNGFFRRALVESCVVGKYDNPIIHPSCGEVQFSAALRGDPRGTYVIACDPASEVDNLSIVVLEVWPEHRRIVNVWTTNRERHKAKFKKGLAKQKDFYKFAARKMRDLMKVFPCVRLALDSQGGGVAIVEALQDPDNLEPGELPIYPVPDPDPKKKQDTDGMAGLHILELVNFAKADWVSEANHGMRKDFEDKTLLFPEFDAALLGVAIEEDMAAGRVNSENEKLYDTLEDCIMEIEELKDELATIVHTQTGTSMRDRWDTPEVKLAGGKKGRLRKDRYSALLMGNMSARIIQRTPEPEPYQPWGGFAQDVSGGKPKDGPMWTGPDWWAGKANNVGGSYGAVVRRS